MRPPKTLAAALTLLLAWPQLTPAQQPVTIANPGFEIPPVNEGVYPGTITGWSEGSYDVSDPGVWIAESTEAGYYNPRADEYSSAAAAEGLNMAYLYGISGYDTGLSQVLTATLQPETRYTLSAKVGNPFQYNGGPAPDYRIELLAGGVLLKSATGSAPADDLSFGTATLTYLSPPAPAQAGQPLEIRLLAVEDERDNFFELDFDDVRLTTSVPAPGYPAWQAANDTTQPPGGDHDGDGIANRLEWFFGGSTSTTGFTPLPAAQNNAITWTKAGTFPGAYGPAFVVETAPALAGPWTAEAPSGNVTLSGNNVTFTFPAGTRRFARLTVTGP